MSYIVDSRVKNSLSFYIKECIAYLHILKAFTVRQIKIKYANATIGILWAIIQPAIYITLLVTIFNKVAGLETAGIDPYAYAAVGLIPWIYFSTSISNSVSVAVSSQDIISKVYFPRIFLSLSVMGEALIDLIIIILISLVLGAWTFGSWNLLFPVILLCLFALVLGVSAFVSMLSIKFPDVRFLIPLVLRILIFITPIAYASDLFVGNLKFLLFLNPLVGLIEGFRFSITGVLPDTILVITAVFQSIVFLIISMILFVRFDRKIGDLI